MKLNDAVLAFRLNEGSADALASADAKVSSAISAPDGVNRWAVWLKSENFGYSLDFSTEGSLVFIDRPGFDLEDCFTISAWVKVPPREAHDRVIISGGALTSNSWKLFVDYATGEAAFAACGITAARVTSGVKIADGLWHHVMVTYGENKLSFIIDKNAAKTVDCSGKIYVSSQIFLGCDVNGENGLDGSLAEIAIYKAVKSADEVTDTVCDNAKEPLLPRMHLKKGLVLDRCQAHVPKPKSATYKEWDALCVKKLGFDHIKILLTPHHSKGENGKLLPGKLKYITGAVDAAVAAGLPCILCIHPEPAFKTDGLQEGTHFDKLIRWYSEFAHYFKKHWKPDEVALQLMTEPFADTPDSRWTWFSDRIWGTVRNIMPDHTLITSSDTAGNLERVKTMSPTTDTNLIYSFTTYEPYTAGFNALKGLGSEVSIWNFLRNIRYPVEPGMTADEMDAIVADNIALVPDDMKDEAKKYMYAYYRGEYDGHEFFVNHYDLTYNADWNMLRMKSLDNWRKKYGGNIHIMCVEFGCLDEYIARKLFKGAEGTGLAPETRIKHIGDLRRAFEAFDIGWSYWSYNEAFTVLKPELRKSGYNPRPEELDELADFDLLRNALGLNV